MVVSTAGWVVSAMSELLSEIVPRGRHKNVVAKLTEWGWAMGVGDLIMRKSEVMTTSCSVKFGCGIRVFCYFIMMVHKSYQLSTVHCAVCCCFYYFHVQFHL